MGDRFRSWLVIASLVLAMDRRFELGLEGLRAELRWLLVDLDCWRGEGATCVCYG